MIQGVCNKQVDISEKSKMTTINLLIHLHVKWEKHSFNSYYSSVKAMQAAQGKPMPQNVEHHST